MICIYVQLIVVQQQLIEQGELSYLAKVMYVRICSRMYRYIYIYIYIYIGIYAHIYVCIYIHIGIYVYIYIYTHVCVCVLCVTMRVYVDGIYKHAYKNTHTQRLTRGQLHQTIVAGINHSDRGDRHQIRQSAKYVIIIDIIHVYLAAFVTERLRRKPRDQVVADVDMSETRDRAGLCLCRFVYVYVYACVQRQGIDARENTQEVIRYMKDTRQSNHTYTRFFCVYLSL
jgi:hypothetical protein